MNTAFYLGQRDLTNLLTVVFIILEIIVILLLAYLSLALFKSKCLRKTFVNTLNNFTGEGDQTLSCL